MEKSKLKLKKIYKDIIQGFSFFNTKHFGSIYIKHLTDFDNIILEQKLEEFSNLAIKKNLILEKDKLEYLFKENIWTQLQEKELQDEITFLKDMYMAKSKIVVPSELDSYNEAIKESEKKIKKLQLEKDELLGLTVEKYANKKINEYYIIFLSYKTSEFKETFFTQNQYDELEDEEILEIHNIYWEYGDYFNSLNLKKIAISPFFLNPFYLCDGDAFKFYGKPVSTLSNNQIELFHHGLYFKHLLSENRNIQITEEILENPDKLTEEINLKKNIEKILDNAEKSTGEGGVVSIVGAKNKHLEKLGFTTSNLNERMAEAAKKKGRKLKMEEVLAIEEGKNI